MVVDYSSIILSLFGGFISTFVMTLFEIPFWKKWGLEGILEWHENQILYSKFFNTNKTRINFIGIFFLHFINGGLGGVVFYLLLLIFPFLNTIIFYIGIIYGLILWILTLLPIHKPITGIDPIRHPLGFSPAITSLVGHSIYGITLSFILVSLL